MQSKVSDHILVLSEDYPSPEKPYAMSYVHSRSINYLRAGITPTVGSFRCKHSYEIDGIKVIYPSLKIAKEFDTIFCHAPNIKNHFWLLKSLENKRIIFFIHGHEVLHSKDYPEPYMWNKIWLKQNTLYTYDNIKLLSLPYILRHLAKKNDVKFVFVSTWMKEQFNKRINIELDFFDSAIIANGVHPVFQEKCYSSFKNTYHKRDVITIRPLDQSKYAIDRVLDCARANPDLNFDVYGKGKFFLHNPPPKNIHWHDKFIDQASMPELLGKYKLALMPTLYDAQGVSVCEMATFGMPVITSDIPVCREMFSDFPNVMLIDNREFSSVDILPYLSRPISMPRQNDKFNGEKLAFEELRFAMGGGIVS